MTADYKLKRDGTVAVDSRNEWQPMSTCPLSAKVQLLGKGGVAVYGQWDGKNPFWLGWHPVPKMPAAGLDNKTAGDEVVPR